MQVDGCTSSSSEIPHPTKRETCKCTVDYLEHLMKEGSQEGDSGADLELPSWYDEQLFRR